MGRFVVLAVLAGCGSQPVGPDAQSQERALEIVWRMPGFPEPAITWYAAGDDGCGNALPGTAFADGKCIGGQISIAGDHRTSSANIEWTGSLETSPLCWATISLRDGINTHVLLGVDITDRRITDCRASISGL